MAALVAYLRTRHDGASAAEVDFEQQRSAIEAWAKRRRHQIVWIVKDSAARAPLDERGGLVEALALLGTGPATGMVVCRLACLDEDLVTQELLLAEVARLGARLLSVSPEDGPQLRRVPTDESRRRVRDVLRAAAAKERALIALRSASARPTGGSPPYGYRSENGNVVPEPDEQAALARIVELRANGATLREIARALHAEGHPPKRSRRWHAESVRRIVDRSGG